MMRISTLILGGLAVASTTSGPVHAAGPAACATADTLTGLLDRSYGELPISNGLQKNGQLLQIYASPTTGTWTAVTTTPTRVSCVLATGRNWGDEVERNVAASQVPAARMPSQ
jgi:hypothetical protein